MGITSQSIILSQVKNGKSKDQEGNEWVVNYFEPIIEKEITIKNQILLRCRYYADSERMAPALLRGDLMLLRKIDKILEYGAIHLIQTDDFNIVCRPNTGASEDTITLNYDSKNVHYNGQELPRKYIKAIWELVASNRIHKNIITPIAF